MLDSRQLMKDVSDVVGLSVAHVPGWTRYLGGAINSLADCADRDY
jgi:hypothetical protein